MKVQICIFNCLIAFLSFFSEFVVNKKPTTTPLPTTTTPKSTTTKKQTIRRPIIIRKPPMPTRQTKGKIARPQPTKATERKTTQSAPIKTTSTTTVKPTTVQRGATIPVTTPSTGRPTGAPVYHPSSTAYSHSGSAVNTSSKPTHRVFHTEARGQGARINTGAFLCCTTLLLYTISMQWLSEF